VSSSLFWQAVDGVLGEGFARISLAHESAERLSEVFEYARAFFRGQDTEKRKNTLPEGLGYRPMGIEYSQSPKRPDHIESFSASARTPGAYTSSLSVSARRLYHHMMKAIDVLEAIAETLAARG